MKIFENYKKIKGNIAELATKCGREPKEISLIAVSKGRPIEEVLEVYQTGCRDFGENRVQEALEKIEVAPKEIHWHMIGNLQFNKVRKAVDNFALIHSVDTPELAQAISLYCLEKGVRTPILLEVNTSGEPTKHGLSVEAWREVYPAIKDLQGVEILGLMTMAPFVQDEKTVRTCFVRLRELRDEFGLHHLSMGMSNDYPWAIMEGATLLRIGSAIFH